MTTAISGAAKHVAYQPPGLTCLDPLGDPHCLLVWAGYDHADGWIARLYQVGLVVPSAIDDPITYVSGSYWNSSRNGFGHVGLCGSSNGWFMTRLANPDFKEDIAWNVKPEALGIGGVWGTNYSSSSYLSQQGFSVAYSYRLGVYRLAWTEE